MTADQLTLLDLLPERRPESYDGILFLDTVPAEYPGPKPDREFTESVQRFGVIEPVVVLKRLTQYRVADGRRRIMAAHAVGLDRVPARFYPMDGISSPLLTLILNDRRSPNPVAEYHAIRDLMGQGAGESLIVQATGLPVARLRRRLKLGSLDASLLDALAAGRITVSVAEACAKLPPPIQAELVGALNANGKLTSHDVATARRARASQAAATLPADLFATESPDLFLGASPLSLSGRGAGGEGDDWRAAARANIEKALQHIPVIDWRAKADPFASIRDGLTKALAELETPLLEDPRSVAQGTAEVDK